MISNINYVTNDDDFDWKNLLGNLEIEQFYSQKVKLTLIFNIMSNWYR